MAGHRAAFYINGTPRPWTDQADGPALQTLTLLAMYRQLDTSTQAIAAQLISANLNFLAGAYQGQTYNLWEEEYGYSFFARSAQLRCFQAIAANTIGVTVPTWLPSAVTWLTSARDSHWNGSASTTATTSSCRSSSTRSRASKSPSRTFPGATRPSSRPSAPAEPPANLRDHG